MGTIFRRAIILRLEGAIYPSWTKDNVVPIAMSKTLSVNVAQYAILNFAAFSAEKLNIPVEAEKYKTWAIKLKDSINRCLYNEDLDYYYVHTF